ncbi:hypothetical protein [Methylobacterium sp. 1973]|uniref:hypothetical protein n=1 Tax=Methylobacterium sp. 1973 TaxID=3156421 RepID=UPI0033950BD3
MIQRTLVATTIPMARRLARLDPVTRSSPGLAAAALRPDFLAEDIDAHLSEAMGLVPAMVRVAESDRPWVLAAGHLLTAASLAVLCGGGVYLWAVLS